MSATQLIINVIALLNATITHSFWETRHHSYACQRQSYVKNVTVYVNVCQVTHLCAMCQSK